MDNKKEIRAFLIAILAVLIFLVFLAVGEFSNINSSISSISSQVSNIGNVVINDTSVDDDNYDVDCKVVKVDSDAPYKIEAEFTYSAVQFPSNADVYFTITNKDSSVTKIEAKEENGTFVGKSDIDLTEIDTDASYYVFIDDGENVTKYEYYLDLIDGYREYSNSANFSYTKTKSGGVFELDDDNVRWSDGSVGKVTNAYFEVSKGDEVVYTKELQIENADSDSAYDHQLVIPSEITVGKEVDGFSDVYILLVDENGVEMRIASGEVLDDDTYECVDGTSLIFTKDGKTVTVTSGY
jgi:hypothetical protein